MPSETKPTMESRLAAIEATLSSLVDHVSVDSLIRRKPIGDPPPNDLLNTRLIDLIARRHIGDPPTIDLVNTRLIDLVTRYRGGVSDPPPDEFAGSRLGELFFRVPGGGISDPAPEDIKRLGQLELEAHVSRIDLEIKRLTSVKEMLQKRLAGP